MSAVAPPLTHTFKPQLTRNSPTTTSLDTHLVSIPEEMSADPQNGIVWPLLLHFHGWGGDASECGQTCRSVIPSRGIITVALTGVVGSWNGVGTAASPGPDGATC